MKVQEIKLKAQTDGAALPLLPMISSVFSIRFHCTSMISQGIRAFQRVGYDRRLIENERIYINALRRIARPRDVPCRRAVHDRQGGGEECALFEALEDAALLHELRRIVAAHGAVVEIRIDDISVARHGLQHLGHESAVHDYPLLIGGMRSGVLPLFASSQFCISSS